MGRNVIIVIVVVVAIIALVCCCCVASGLMWLIPVEWKVEELGGYGVSQPMAQTMPASMANAMPM